MTCPGIPVEAPVELHINGKKALTFMCTPEELKELAVGYMLTAGLIKSLDELLTMAVCSDLRKIYVNLAGEISPEDFTLSGVLTSGCGSQVISLESLLNLSKRVGPGRTSLQTLKEWARAMLKGAVLYRRTGGLHCAALAGCGRELVLCEDIGRHNAVDKVLGKGFLRGYELTGTVLLTTGRIAADMALKAAVAGCGIVATRSVPTDLALDIAVKAGITIVGRIVSPQPVVFTNKKRIVDC